MFETKTGLRSIATLITIIAVTLGATPMANASAPYQKTVNFISSKFEKNQYIANSAGKPQFGFTIESMLQLRAAGKTAGALKAAVDYNLRSTANSGMNTKVGNLFVDRKFEIARGGMFLVASKAFGLPKSSLRSSVLKSVKAAVSKTGELSDSYGSTFAYGWTVLGLTASGETKLAGLVASKLATLARPDGGFGQDLTADSMSSTADATGMALMALAAAGKTTSATVKKATDWLARKSSDRDYFESWGNFDVNGTAYALMGLDAVGRPNDRITEWLQEKVSDDGGLISAYSDGKPDIIASAQGYLALIGSNYVALIK